MNLLFDCGGVLIDLNRQHCIDAFAKVGFDIRPLLGTYVQSGVFSKLERGLITVPQFCEELRGYCTLRKPTDEEIVSAWELYLDGIPAERLEMLLKLRERHHVYALSNISPIHWDLCTRDYFRYKGHTLDDFFEKTFLSFELGVEKPSPVIFDAVVKGIGCRPEDILFFDDSEVNCEGARRFGMQARLAPAGGKWLDYFTSSGEYIPEN